MKNNDTFNQILTPTSLPSIRASASSHLPKASADLMKKVLNK